VDKRTGRPYLADSGEVPDSVHPLLKDRIPNPSLERWTPENCAEFNAVNKALNEGAKIEDLVVHTVQVRSGNPFPRCNNCRVTTAGAIVTSD
jgi:hypothetical protein